MPTPIDRFEFVHHQNVSSGIPASYWSENEYFSTNYYRKILSLAYIGRHKDGHEEPAENEEKKRATVFESGDSYTGTGSSSG